MAKKTSNKSLYTIYAILGAILLGLLVMIALSLLKKTGKPVVILNQLDEGIAQCNKAASLFQQDSEKAGEALKILEEGIGKMETELNKYRDAESNLPAKYSGHDSKLAEMLSLRKGFREQCFIEKEKKERKGSGN